VKGATIIPVFLLAMLLCVQAPLVSRPQEPPQSGDIIKISTDLALVDALITNQQKESFCSFCPFLFSTARCPTTQTRPNDTDGGTLLLREVV
jgi:hypothetical protein